MQQLSKSEEQLMEYIWQQDRVFLKEIMELYPDPKPAVTTVMTLLKRIQEKGYVAYQLYGNSRQYYPLVKKSDYFSRHVKGIISNYFENSPLQFASFFTREADFTTDQLEELRKIVELEIEKRKK
ncbi:BlaI family penicillinase repressor [Parabacteroides sp. PFB2-10]|uniref:BlaI/MecI/CopY family transcriptional regulator n=1 Tax=Parabacteroides sp. PFB2-10 TaxID=1742405 RepID=UPI0024766AB7|nr:BlaI/MecI/CopY family transcriptional regulator [Parabacteroides sp. PFB2-10]MDH6312337.1 BlaI family penicillinase repressor [Parabacteroides sp. PFB2-10]